jgi:hypothetical protein
LKSGGYREHFYFRCSKFNNPSCRQPSVQYVKLIKQLVTLLENIDVSKLSLPEEMQDKIMDYYMIKTIASQNPAQTILLLRSQNQKFTELTPETIKDYFRYVILCKSTKDKIELLKVLNIRFLLNDKKLIKQL